MKVGAQRGRGRGKQYKEGKKKNEDEEKQNKKSERGSSVVTHSGTFENGLKSTSLTGLAGPCMPPRGRAATACTPAIVRLSGTAGGGPRARSRGDPPPVGSLGKRLFGDGFVRTSPETVGATTRCGGHTATVIDNIKRQN